MYLRDFERHQIPLYQSINDGTPTVPSIARDFLDIRFVWAANVVTHWPAFSMPLLTLVGERSSVSPKHDCL